MGDCVHMDCSLMRCCCVVMAKSIPDLQASTASSRRRNVLDKLMSRWQVAKGLHHQTGGPQTLHLSQLTLPLVRFLLQLGQYWY
ncbi:hypothetical protein O9993_11110 [Vibrio lentus]|nr:hypothetical protein [Vibrio lentus]